LAIRLAAGLAVVLGVGGFAWTVWPQAAAEESSERRLAAVSLPDAAPLAPTSHAAIYKKLATPVRARFNKVALGEVLQRLSAASGVDIELVGSAEKISGWPVTLTNPEPVTLENALHLALRQGGNCRIALDDKGVRIVFVHEAADQYVLETHQLWSASNYTTRARARFIERVRREIAPEVWGRPDGPWIVPARSVFAIDVYHTPGVQESIRKLWWSENVAKREPAAKKSERFESFRALDKKKATSDEIRGLSEKLKKEHPLVSLTDRLAYERDESAPERPSIAPEVERHLAAAEEAIERRSWRKTPGMNVRALSLKQLHGDSVEEFITSPGFGESRMPSTVPGPAALASVQLKSLPLPSAEIDPPSDDPAASLALRGTIAPVKIGVLPALDRLESLHQFGIRSFLSPLRFGYVKDRDHVAGFDSHGFENLPRLEFMQSPAFVAMTNQRELASFQEFLPPSQFDEPAEQWAIRRLELVSLLKHDTPRVYVSDNLPRMEELKERPTRPLNAFETDAIPRLVESKDLVARATINRIEMVGAIRVARQCLECHQVERGQLLGAFSYTLVRDPLVLPAVEDNASRLEPTRR